MEEKTKLVAVRLTEAEARALKEFARIENRTVSNTIRIALIEGLRRRGIEIKEPKQDTQYDYRYVGKK